MPPPDPSADQARAAIQAALGQIGFTLPGTITIRRARCGKPRCACAADPPSLHGPYIQWTRTVNGKTVTRLLTPAQYQAYAPWFANARRLRALTAELQALSLQEMARAEGWATITPGTPGPARTKLARVPNQPITTQNAGRSARLTREPATASNTVTLVSEFCRWPVAAMGRGLSQFSHGLTARYRTDRTIPDYGIYAGHLAGR